jgi:hypothetical protein
VVLGEIVRVVVSFDVRQFEIGLRGLERQIPFATALALTRTAKDAQAQLRGDLDDHFTIRDKWVSKGIRITPAKKKKLVAEVGSWDSFMRTQVLGGEKNSQQKAMGIPLVGKGMPRRTIKKRTLRSRWPGKLLQKSSKYFIGRPRGYIYGNAPQGVYRRLGKGGRGTLRLMWLMKDVVNINSRWPLLETVEDVVEEMWSKRAEQALWEAFDSSR